MLQMRQSMPNNIPSLRKYQVHPIDLSQMWVDCYPSEDTNEGETMNCDWCGDDFDTDDRGVLTIHEKAPLEESMDDEVFNFCCYICLKKWVGL